MTESKLSAFTAAFFAATLLLVGCGDDGGCPNGNYLCSSAATCAEDIYSSPSSAETCVAEVCAAFGTNDCVAQLMAENDCAAAAGCSLDNCQAESDAADACTGN